MALYNPTNGIGQFLETSINMTGSMFLTLLLISILLMVVILLVRLPLELSLVFILPLHLAILSYYGEYMSVAGSFLIIAGVILAKNFIHT